VKILFLGYTSSPLIEWIGKTDQVKATDERLTLQEIQEYGPSLIISYGYKYILRPPVIRAYAGKIINLHISYLPWNRGCHPNFWSFYDDTPKGVTIHYIDEGVDTGDVLVQKEVDFAPEEDTLSKTYTRLRDEIEEMFIANWPKLRLLALPARPCAPRGSHHFRRDLDALWGRLSDGWRTPIHDVEALRARDKDNQKEREKQ